MSGLGVPTVKMLAHFLKKRGTDGLSSQCQDTARKVGKVENVKVLSAGECAGDTFSKSRLLVTFC